MLAPGAKSSPSEARLQVGGVAQRSNERRAAELAHRQAKQQMLHGRIAANRDVDNIGGVGAERMGQIVGPAH